MVYHVDNTNDNICYDVKKLDKSSVTVVDTGYSFSHIYPFTENRCAKSAVSALLLNIGIMV